MALEGTYAKWRKHGTITAITANATASDAIYPENYDYVAFEVTLTGGTGNCTYKFQKTMLRGGTLVDTPEQGTTTTTITQTATGTFKHVVAVQGDEEVRLTSIDCETGSYTINAKYRAYNEGV